MENVQFLNQEHLNKFREIRVGMASEYYRNSPEYLAVAYLLAGHEELRKKAAPYFDTQKGMFSSIEMFEEVDFSSGIRTLAKLAVHLFNNNEKLTPLDLVGDLDTKGFDLAINAIKLRRSRITNGYDFPEEKIYS